MTGEAEDWSDYIKHRSNLINIFALLCGFTFTAATILDTSLPQPENIPNQLVLLFSAILFDLFVFLLLLNTVNIFNYIQKIPSPTRTTNIISVLSVTSIALWGYLLPSILFLFDFESVGIVASAIWTVVLVIGFLVIYRPFEMRRRSRLD